MTDKKILHLYSSSKRNKVSHMREIQNSENLKNFLT